MAKKKESAQSIVHKIHRKTLMKYGAYGADEVIPIVIEGLWEI